MPRPNDYPYWWLDWKSTNVIRDLLNKAGPKPRLEVHLMSGMNLYFDIFDEEGNEIGGENESHICPPQC